MPINIKFHGAGDKLVMVDLSIFKSNFTAQMNGFVIPTVEYALFPPAGDQEHRPVYKTTSN